MIQRQEKAALSENPTVAELLTLLYTNSRAEQATILKEMLSQIGGIEQQLQETSEELHKVQMELKNLREEKDHPIATLYQKAAEALESKVDTLKTHLNDLKENIVQGAKNALNAVKDKGIVALDKIASFFHIKPALQNMHDNLQKNIRADNRAIAEIEQISNQYHNAGMHLKNVGLALTGKETIQMPKPNGKLAKLLEFPFEAEKSSLSKVLNLVDSLSGKVSKLEKSAHQVSIRQGLKDKQKIADKQPQAPVQPKVAEASK